MKYKDEKQLEEYRHECKMTTLAYERETKMIVEELIWKLSYMKYQQPQQQQYYQQPQHMVEQQVPQPQDVDDQEKSAKKYGGKKNG